MVNMQLYIETKLMTLEDGEHEIILRADDKDFFGYERIVDSDILSKNEEDIYMVREQGTWWSFPLYKFKDDKIIPFDYMKYSYFINTDRRMALALKIGNIYNLPSELKILRKTFKYIMDSLDLKYPDSFRKYNDKIEAIIDKNPKDKSK